MADRDLIPKLGIGGTLGQQNLQQALKLAELGSKGSVGGSGKLVDATNSQVQVRHQNEVEKAATQFESLLLHEMMKSMWATVPQDGMLSGSNEEKMYRDMFNEALADQIAKEGSIGIKDVLIQDINRVEKRASNATGKASIVNDRSLK